MIPKVLIVDDDPLMHQLYRRHLEHAGFQMLTAMNGREAMEIADLEVPQVIVMDIMMPEMDGLTAVMGLKKKGNTKAIPIIMITANPMYHLCQRESAWAGAAVFLTKPFSPARLVEEIRRLLSRESASAPAGG